MSGFTPTLMGLAFDSNGNYDLALELIAVALFCSAVLIFFMPKYGSRWLPGVLADERKSPRRFAVEKLGWPQYNIGAEPKRIASTSR